VDCEYCGISGTKDFVTSVGRYHESDCPRRLVDCGHCGISGTKDYVTSKGKYHKDGFHMHAFSCQKCDVHPTGGIIDESAGVWGPKQWIFTPFECLLLRMSDWDQTSIWICVGYLFAIGCVICTALGVFSGMLVSMGLIWLVSVTDLIDGPFSWEGQGLAKLLTMRYQREQQHLMHTCSLRFCQDSIATRFRDGSSVYGPCRGPSHPKVIACFHSEVDGTRLYALNNRTLFNAIHNKVSSIIVHVVDKPSDWESRFTGKKPWLCMRVRHVGQPMSMHVKIPAEAFPPAHVASRCLIVLEARNLVHPKKNNLWSLINDMCPELNAQAVEGDRAYARVRVAQDDEALVRCVVKAIAKTLGKKVNTVDCFEVEELRRFESPRD